MEEFWCNCFRKHFSLFLLCLFHYTVTFKPDGGACYFPERWKGTWFQSGILQPIIIEGPRISSKGRCLGSEGDKFVVVDEKNCYRCVVIHEKHTNVLQYKETYCYGKEALPSLCSHITGDALLYSMFRENAAPVPCPFKGPFTFTYNRGQGECRYPVSSIDVCTEDSKLLLSYQACPDVHGSESTVEELQCLAIWKEGSSRYLVGKVHHSHATSNEDRFRCFVYERVSIVGEATATAMATDDGVEYRVAQSGDATCNGLFSVTEGSRTMTLRKPVSASKCRFPSWAVTAIHWHTLDYSVTYSFHHRNATLRISNSSGLEMKVVCSQIKHTTKDESTITVLAHFTMGCQSGFMCIGFYRRDFNVMEVQAGVQSKRQEDACSSPLFDKNGIPFITLVTATPELRNCPYGGKFSIISARAARQTRLPRLRLHRMITHHPSLWQFRKRYETRDFDGSIVVREKRLNRRSSNCDSDPEFSRLEMGCTASDTMEFRSECTDISSAYSCHGRWEQNGTHYLITTPLSRASYGPRRYCFVYREYVSGALYFSSSSDNCDRSLKPGLTGDLIFNATLTGKCVEVSGSTLTTTSNGLLAIWVILVWLMVQR